MHACIHMGFSLTFLQPCSYFLYIYVLLNKYLSISQTILMLIYTYDWWIHEFYPCTNSPLFTSRNKLHWEWCSWLIKSSFVNNHFEVEGVISDIAGMAKHRQRCKFRAAWSSVYFHLGLPEAGGGRLWTESLDNILSLVLVQQHQGHHLLKWPAQHSIVFPSHDRKEAGEMGALTRTITIQIQPQVNSRDYLAAGE